MKKNSVKKYAPGVVKPATDKATPKVEAPKVEAPKVEAPKVEAPKVKPVKAPPAKKEEEEEEDTKLAKKILEPYFKAYPDEKEFHVTSDGQVFLKRNATDAVAHQKQLNPKHEVTVYEV